MAHPQTGAVADIVAPPIIWSYRHTSVVRATHWINVICILVLVMSGLQIFNATPALYWGQQSRFDAPLLQIVFPSWATLPGYQDLASGRRWHFFFAWVFVINGLVYVLHGLISGHVRRDLVPSKTELGHIGETIKEHALLRFPKGDAARRYNPLQQLSYVGVVFFLLPVTILAGLTMSPAIDAVAPILLNLFGGRQSARTIHFIGAGLIVSFVVVHVIMVLISGVWNNLRSMINGYYAIAKEAKSDDHA